MRSDISEKPVTLLILNSKKKFPISTISRILYKNLARYQIFINVVPNTLLNKAFDLRDAKLKGKSLIESQMRIKTTFREN